MSFAGSWSTAPVAAPAPSGGGWTTGTVLSTGGGWGGGGSTSSGGGWLAPAPTITIAQTSYSVSSTASYPSGYSYSGGGGVYAVPGAGIQAGPFGEGGAYTPLDFPLLHELRSGERLDDLQGGMINRSALPYLALGVVAFLLLKKR